MPIHAPSFRDQFRFTHFPFSDSAVLETVSGRTLPMELFLDLTVSVTGELLTLTRLRKSREGLVFFFGTAYNPTLISFTLPYGGFDGELTAVLYGPEGEIRGSVVYDASVLPMLLAWPDGGYTFRHGGLPPVLSCYRPAGAAGLTGLQFTGEDGILHTQTRDLCLTGADGVQLEQQGNVVTIHFMGDPLYERKRQGELWKTPSFLETLDVMSEGGGSAELTPDADGRVILGTFGMNPDDALRIDSDETGIVFSVAGV
jgi:hypothetical protein